MNKRLLKILPFALASLLIIFISACQKPVSYPSEPKIESISHQIMGDSLQLSIQFTDGDGDFGLNDTDTNGNFSPSSFYHYNVYIEYYEMMNGNWVKGTVDPSGDNFPTADTINYYFRIKNLTPVGQNKTLKGTMNVVLEPIYYNPISHHSDSIKFKVSIIDRALNISNYVETELIVK